MNLLESLAKGLFDLSKLCDQFTTIVQENQFLLTSFNLDVFGGVGVRFDAEIVADTSTAEQDDSEPCGRNMPDSAKDLGGQIAGQENSKGCTT